MLYSCVLIFQVFGVRSSNGHIEWEHFFPELAPFDGNDQQKLLLYVQRTTAHFPNPPQCTVVGKHKVRWRKGSCTSILIHW